jgi:hypothetical protein
MKPIHHTSICLALSAALLSLNAAAETGQAVALSTVSPSNSVKLTSVATAFASGDQIGEIQAGPQCTSSAPREWSELVRQRVETELPMAFEAEMAKASLAANHRAGMAGDLDVKAFVNDLTLRVCDAGKGAWRGGFYVQVGWQVTRRDTNRLVYQASTAGFFDRDPSRAALTSAYGLREAFAASVRNLLADQRFASILQTSDEQSRTVAAASRY